MANLRYLIRLNLSFCFKFKVLFTILMFQGAKMSLQLDQNRLTALSQQADKHYKDPDFTQFVQAYYNNATNQSIRHFDDQTLVAMAYQHFQLLNAHTQGTPSVAIFNPNKKTHGFDSDYTTVCVVVKDRPFLTDTLLMSLDSQDLGVHRLFNTILEIQSDKKSAITQAKESTSDNADNKAFFYAEIDKVSDVKLDDIKQALLQKIDTIDTIVGDWQAMQDKLTAIKDELASRPIPESVQSKASVLSFLQWIGDSNFIFMGFREYRFDHSGDELELYSVGGSGLGLLKGQKNDALSESFHRLPNNLRHLIATPRVLLLSKSAHLSPVHRPAYMDFLGVQKFDDNGKLIGEYRFLGLLTSNAYHTQVAQIPLLQQKTEQILNGLGLIKGGHSYTKVAHIINTLPRDDLFQASIDELSEIVMDIASLQDKNALKLFGRIDHYQRFVSCLVYIPKHKFNTQLRQKIGQALIDAFNGTSSSFTTDFNEVHHTRVHYHIRTSAGQVGNVDVPALEQQLADLMHDWRDDVKNQIKTQLEDKQLDDNIAKKLSDNLSFVPASYQERFDGSQAIEDGKQLLALKDQTIIWRLLNKDNKLALKVYGKNEPATLSQILPILENFGLTVLSAQTYRFASKTPVWLQEYRLVLNEKNSQDNQDSDSKDRNDNQKTIDFDTVKDQVEQALAEIWHGQIESDPLNELILTTALNSYDVVVLRALSRYMIQATAPFSTSYIHQTLLSNKKLASLLIELFHCKFDPKQQDDRTKDQLSHIHQRIDDELTQVSSLDEDRIIHWFIELLQAMVRTNFYQSDDNGNKKDRLSFKFKASDISGLPKPKPMFEIYVYSPRTEGVHLRGGKVARGGLRWSDRMEDYRTEVLGLVKAQMVKNAVIVPVGSKGGFVVKDKSKQSDREAWQKEGVACYQTYIRGLLDITDNLVDGKIAPPADTVRLDEDDPYLVVAADKGTASFSDIANKLSKEYNFWLQDAFASGGSAGYDHKGMGITARGAWESVKRHFRLMNKDIQNKDKFTVVGIGDMSGDVFGNGMLLSKNIELVAAFNHLHIFIDPNPDAEASFKERERLFNMPRSQWADYNDALISAGGGVFSRTDKAITITKEMKARFDIDEDKLTPNELLSYLLKSSVDLIWNGGIGTYIKASDEEHSAVGDRANDPIRVNGEDVRARVIGEGGNLGCTQKGRIEYALNGGRIYTDAIDNSGGVNCSDHEVNIKILLGAAVERGDLTLDERNELLASMTDEVAKLVLRQNYLQPQAIELSAFESHKRLDDNAKLMQYLESQGRLDRNIEFLPNDDTINRRKASEEGLTNPELAVLLAYGKMWVYDEMLASDLPNDDYFLAELKKYFPNTLAYDYFEDMTKHRLHREIICTYLTNGVVNRLGIENVFNLYSQSGFSIADITRAYAVVRDVFGVQSLWDKLSALDTIADAKAQLQIELDIRELLKTTMLWFLDNEDLQAVDQITNAYKDDVQALITDNKLADDHLQALAKTKDNLVAQNVPSDEADVFARLAMLPYLLDVVKLAKRQKTDVKAVAYAYFKVYHALNLDQISDELDHLPKNDYWERRAINALTQELKGTVANLSAVALKQGLDTWLDKHKTALSKISDELDGLKDNLSLASLSVLLSEINTLKDE